MRVLSRSCLVVALVVGPLACASAPQRAGAAPPTRPLRSHAEIKDRDRALVAGLVTSLAFGLVGLGTLLTQANLGKPAHAPPPPGMPPLVAVAGGVMSAGFLLAIPFGVAVERHRNLYPEVLKRRPPQVSATLRPTTRLGLGPRTSGQP